MLLAVTPVQAADDSPSVPGSRIPWVSAVEQVRLVLLPTSVTTRRGKPVRGLRREDFLLFEDDLPREIGYFATEENAPIALAFLLDVSGSMKLGNRLEQSKRSIHAIVRSLRANDRVGLICFANDQIRWVTDFTTDRERFATRLDAQEAAGRTALYDALAAAAHLVDKEFRGRKAIVLVTDGLDNASEEPTLRSVMRARRVNVPIYSLNFIPMRESLLARRARDAVRFVRRFSIETGGTLHMIHGERDLERATAEIQSELRHQYVIGYYPRDEDQDGTFKVIKLLTPRKGLTVRTRRGYFAYP